MAAVLSTVSVRPFCFRFKFVSNLDKKHVCSIFVWIVMKLQWLPLILNGNSTGKVLVYLYVEILNFFLFI